MWTLLEAKERLADRVGEATTVTTFWSDAERTDAINEAVRFIAAVTNGVPLTTTGEINSDTPYLDIAGNVTGMHGSVGRVTDGAALNIVPITVADVTFPNWRTTLGTPRWVVLDTANSRAYLVPQPFQNTEIEVTVSVIPDEVSNEAHLLFNGNASMVKYLGAMLNVAASKLLLKERFDGEAERFFQSAIAELQSVGVDPTSIPSLKVPNANG